MHSETRHAILLPPKNDTVHVCGWICVCVMGCITVKIFKNIVRYIYKYVKNGVYVGFWNHEITTSTEGS